MQEELQLIGWNTFTHTHTLAHTLRCCCSAHQFSSRSFCFFFVYLFVNDIKSIEAELEQQWLLGNGGAGGVFEGADLVVVGRRGQPRK